MPKFYEYRTHFDHRRSGSYDIIPDVEGDFNFTKHNPNMIPEELHMHKRQTDYFTVAQGRVMFLMIYEDGKKEKFILTENDHKTLVIPPGIWHNYMAIVPSIMIFYLSHKYDPHDEFKRKADPGEWVVPVKDRPLRVLYFGSYDPEYSTNKILINGLKQNGVEVIECQDDSPGLRKFWKLFLKHWNLRNDYDAMVVGFLGQVIMPLAKLIAGKPIIFNAPVSLYDANVRDRKVIKPKSLKAAYYWFLDWLSMSLADRVFCGTAQDVEYAINEFHLKKEKFRRIFIGAENDVFRPMADKTINDSFLVSFHGTFIPVQGVEFIVRAAKILEDRGVRFLIIGDGQEKKRILRLVEELKVKNVEFLNLLPKKELVLQIAKADACLGIFGDTPRTQRAIPFKIYECLAMRKPVITADTPAVRELFNERDIMLIKAADSEALAKGILRLKNDSELLTGLAQNGYNKFMKFAAPRVLGGELKKIIMELVR